MVRQVGIFCAPFSPMSANEGAAAKHRNQLRRGAARWYRHARACVPSAMVSLARAGSVLGLCWLFLVLQSWWIVLAVPLPCPDKRFLKAYAP